MMYCKNCGAPYKGGCICEKCGSRFSDEEMKEENKKNNRGLKIVIIFVVLFVFLIIVMILGAIFIPALIGYTEKVRENSGRMSQHAAVQMYEANVTE